ncbi:MAG: hypothetical protein KY468_18880, partial [Armatimonadetes bacterium]|nr:hypothetical protein [Armatimonadota bacterium]
MSVMERWLEHLHGLAPFQEGARLLQERQAPSVEGINTAAKAHWAAASARDFSCTLIVTPTEDAARALFDDLYTLRPERVFWFPASEVWTQGGDAESAALRVLALDAVRKGEGGVVVGSAQAVFQRTASRMDTVELRAGETREFHGLLGLLTEMGYDRVTTVERPGQLAVRGGILDLFPSTLEQPVRIDFFGDEVESIRIFDVETQRSVEKCDSVEILPAREEGVSGSSPTLLDLLPDNALLLLDEPNAIHGHFTEFLADFHERRVRREQEAEEEDDIIHLDPVPPADTYAPWENMIAALGRVRHSYLQQFPRAIPWEKSAVAVETHAKTPERFSGRIPDFAKELMRRANIPTADFEVF